jgi:hypothetical protein
VHALFHHVWLSSLQTTNHTILETSIDATTPGLGV